MAEYRIVTKIDPTGVVAGRQKVRQELQGMASDAEAAGRRGKAGIEQMTAAQFRAAGGVEGLSKANKAATTSQSQLEAATRRVLAAVDQEAAAQLRLNQLLKDAKMALDGGAISAEQYARVQKLAADGVNNIGQSLGRTRAGFTQLSFQLGDISQQMALGTRGSTIFAEQSGQVIQALQIMGGQGNAFLKFLGGPWGIAITTAAVVLGPYISKLFDTNDALGESVDKLQQDAKQTEIDRQAKERFRNSEEGLAAAVRDRLAAMREAEDKERTQGERDNLLAQGAQNRAKAIRDETSAILEQAIAQEKADQIRAQAPGQRGELGAMADARSTARVAGLQDLLAQNQQAVDNANSLFVQSLGELAQEAAKKAADPGDAIKQKYEGHDGIIATITREGLAQKDITTNREKQLALTRKLTDAYKDENKELEDARKKTRDISDGVERFRSREQAIGIAGRELLGAGLSVGENVQFGGVHANHPGMGNAAHGKYAIDVNQGAGVVEANLPDLRAHFDTLARAYQQRGYRVLWNGQVYEANGSGPTRPIPPGMDQHRDHLHVEAPATIVGKPTESSYAQDQLRDYKDSQQEAARKAKEEAALAERKTDFVQRIIDDAATGGKQPSIIDSTKAKIARALADYKRQFDEVMSSGDAQRVTQALNDAQAREISQRFDDAYVEPLKRQRDTLGQTAVERQILTAKEKDAHDIGRALLPAEEALIDAYYRQGDVLKRENDILVGIRQPLEDYRQQIAALVDLLAKGQINQTQFNARVSELGSTARGLIKDLPQQAVDPNSHQTYGDISARAEEDARYKAQLDALQSQREQLLKMGLDYNALEEAAYQQHIKNLNDIDMKRRETQLQAAQSISESLLTIAEAAAGKQSAVYRSLFAISKAFAIAQASLALYQNVAEAMKYGFPQNLPFIAAAFAQGAAIVSAVESVANPGFMVGGYTGDGARDKPAGTVHGQEFVVNAEGTRSNRALLEAINAGWMTRPGGRASNDNRFSDSPRPLTVHIDSMAAPGVDYDVAQMTDDRVEIIARRVVDARAPQAVATHLQNPNSKVSKSLSRVTTAKRKRG